jgi:hypothetical protein
MWDFLVDGRLPGITLAEMNQPTPIIACRVGAKRA